MKIIYCCYGGAHTSIVASSIHMGYLPTDKIPTSEEILSVPYYDQSANNSVGTPLFMGVDEYTNEVYVMGMGHHRDYYAVMTYEYAHILASDKGTSIRIINALSCINNYIRIGGFLSRRANLISIGRPLTVFGIQRNYKYFVELVSNLKKAIKVD
ncbi:DUF3189 family protein [Serpentinicella sp. ANB-PHB4]|uniref:DUF3189 family protein n=1 Tax=Serpentinicella sp. ANB-PHB4 TaxID=3074076 RepID=UPI002854461E|nr:DUF3189 family protein [Serpentinicella sp. ANB-PHB4]MDR5657912.1 DUF3189 family protein [Serpentinicella sp. ANB-PHB4]